MVLTCALASVFVKYLGIKWTLILGAARYAPFAAGLYCNNRFQSAWAVLFGAACCGLGAGIFWMAEAAIALSYPEPHNQGRFLGLWLSFRVAGQILGGAINLALNAKRDEQGAVSYTVYLVFIAIQAAAPFAGLLLSPPNKVQRTDGVIVSCSIPKEQRILQELSETGRRFLSRKYLLIVPLIAQSVFAEAVFFTYAGLWFTVRARALGSFLSGIMAICAGNFLGAFIDRNSLSLKLRTRGAFAFILTLQGAWWLWGTVNVTRFRELQPVYDWTTPGFGNAFAWFLVEVGAF
ncbi:hypothetical protein LTR37_003850 [Vermiconidia calcicola]|uniref:Uncharacterized protein n=1 Tax=Vermiconidia calcicola TaxID=1690605 RepID=A0ACC3NP19_9PEZI|nr:hypothetical protein LTR37_003850 [Vermiconidia calcicola]